MKRVAVVGAGGMARVRTRALKATGQANICGVASRHLSTARAFGAGVGCDVCLDDYRRLADAQAHPDAVLVEVPHEAQDDIVLWALEHDLHVLIGGSLATSTRVGGQIAELAQSKHLVVEAGYEARYSPAWERVKQLIRSRELGDLVTVRSIALWAGDPRTWYYHQQASGGMPLTHMTYCFVNPVRWIAGEASMVSAFASRLLHTAPELVSEENCVANLLLEGDVLCSMTAGFVAPAGLPAWSTTFICTKGAVEIAPDEGGSGIVTVYRGGAPERLDFHDAPNAFDLQARAFLAALEGRDTGACRNTPADALGDVRVAEAIVASIHEGRTIKL